MSRLKRTVSSVAWAIDEVPQSNAASVSAPSIPAVTPAALRCLPSSTTRLSVGIAPKYFRRSNEAQCVVDLTPFSSPAAPQIRAPVQTE